jgi:NAD(P)-dependent dehydrogenase (short-subunit alcohol dehydrogenase family)
MAMKKVVIITGASSGIGKATALLLTRQAYTVYGLARRIERLKELEPEGVKIIQADVTDELSITAAVNMILENEGKIDILINNAGYGEYGAIEDVTLENAQKQLDVNLLGLARITKLVIPQMRIQQYGKIVNISSIGGKMVSPMGGWYYASKFAVEALSDSLRMEVKPFGIDVIIIEPGGIKTEWGSIADTTLMQASEKSPYARFAQKAHRATALQERLPEPLIIAKLIKKAIEARYPKTRYVKGFMAKTIIFFKWLLSDRLFDKIVMSQFK